MSYWWESEGLRFECQACGRCCGVEPGTVSVSIKERKQIADFLGVSEIYLRQNYMRRMYGETSLKEKENYDCIFLEMNSKKCKVYRVRPLQCRLFPFWPSVLTNKKAWDFYAERCPGMNRGALWSPELIRQFLNLPSACDL